MLKTLQTKLLVGNSNRASL